MATRIFREKDGTYPAYAWPGGYPIYYYCKDGGILCPTCVNDNKEEIEQAEEYEDAQWWIIAQEIHWEGPPLTCDHCYKEIESAYGDPDENQEEENTDD